MTNKRRKKLRVAFRKQGRKRARTKKLTRNILDQEREADQLASEEAIGKGELSRHRTIIGAQDGAAQAVRAVDETKCLAGRVIAAYGSTFLVQAESGRRYECTVREVVRKLAIDERTAVVTGDRVLFLPADEESGVIERVEPRRTTISRRSHAKEHVIAANVEQVLIVVSAADPPLKPGLVDRFLISAEKGGVRPLICINKIDLVDPAKLQPIVGLYGRLGYDVVVASALQETEDRSQAPEVSGQRSEVSGQRSEDPFSRDPTGSAPAAGAGTAQDQSPPAAPGGTQAESAGLPRLRTLVKDRATVISGQSGVGKSSLLNALQPGLRLRVAEVSDWTRKGRHTTRVAEMHPLDFGGWLVDTPGIRQFGLWNVEPAEVEAYFIEFRPFVPLCKFADCTHIHEEGCGVLRAVEHDLIAEFRYDSYVRIVTGDEE